MLYLWKSTNLIRRSKTSFLKQKAVIKLVKVLCIERQNIQDQNWTIGTKGRLAISYDTCSASKTLRACNIVNYNSFLSKLLSHLTY